VGDWIVFIEQGSSSNIAKLWAINASTLTPTLVDSVQWRTKKFEGFDGFATDGKRLIWCRFDQESGKDPSDEWNSLDFDVSGSRTTLAAPRYFGRTPQVIAGNSLIITGGGYDLPDPTVLGPAVRHELGLYLWTLPSAQPNLLAPYDPLTATSYTADTRYMLWTKLPSETLALFDLTTGHETDNWVKSCIRPALAPDCPYAVCLDYTRDQMMLVHVPSGQTQPLGVTNDYARGEIANGRAYWVQPSPGSAFGDTVAYVDLPTT
jgi:hypothetical protein